MKSLFCRMTLCVLSMLSMHALKAGEERELRDRLYRNLCTALDLVQQMRCEGVFCASVSVETFGGSVMVYVDEDQAQLQLVQAIRHLNRIKIDSAELGSFQQRSENIAGKKAPMRHDLAGIQTEAYRLLYGTRNPLPWVGALIKDLLLPCRSRTQ